jgi:hypothetical protein
MAAKKKPASKHAKLKKAVVGKAARTKKKAKKKLRAKKVAQKRSPAKTSGKKKAAAKPIAAKIAPKKEVRGSQPASRPSRAFSRESRNAASGEESGDLQGLSRIEGADSESVDELIEEGNAFEAGVVQGVEDAGNAEGQEVHTHEVPEDDVPQEYLDED